MIYYVDMSDLAGISKAPASTLKSLIAAAAIGGAAFAGGAGLKSNPVLTGKPNTDAGIGAAIGLAVSSAIAGLISKGNNKPRELDPLVGALVKAASRPYEKISDQPLLGMSEYNLYDLLDKLHSEEFVDAVSRRDISPKTLESLTEAIKAVLVISASTGNYLAMREILDRSNLKARQETRKIPENTINWNLERNALNAAFSKLATNDIPVLQLALNLMAIHAARYQLEAGNVASTEVQEAIKLIFSTKTCHDIRVDHANRIYMADGQEKELPPIEWDEPFNAIEIPTNIETLSEILRKGEEMLIKNRASSPETIMVRTLGDDPEEARLYNRIHGIAHNIVDLKIPSLINQGREITYQVDLNGVIACYGYLSRMFSQLVNRNAEQSIATFGAVRKKIAKAKVQFQATK